MVKKSPLKVALTGSIAMGKSTVAQMLRDAGIRVFDADAEVHAMYGVGGEAVPLIAERFPAAVRDGKVDRALLSALVLDNAAAVEQLESIVHPLVREKQQAFLDNATRQDASIVVFDIPLLFETGRADSFDIVLVVSAAERVQRERALARTGMTEEKLQAILSRQMSDKNKRSRATHTILTDVPLADTRAQVLAIVNELQRTAGKRK